MSKDTSEPAFPRTGSRDIQGYGVDDQEGMTLRQWYAGLAMQGMLAGQEPYDNKELVTHAFEVADAMIAEGSK